MDAVSDPTISEVVVMSSAQVGKTEIINNVVGYHIHQDPAPILVLQPTLEMAQTWSKDRLSPMVRDTVALRGKIKDPRSRDSGNTMLHKTFSGGHITMAGANSAASLASRPIRILLCDEVDRYPPSAGTEGDPVNLAKKRTTTFWNRKIVLVSTPTVAGISRIERAFEETDQRRFYIPCAHCGNMDHIRWANVQWTDDDPQTAMLICEKCGGGINDNQRRHAISFGEWRATADSSRAGFHLSEMYSPWRSLSEIVADFLNAKKSPELLKTWVNTSLGETWEEEGETVEHNVIAQRREPYRLLPPDALVVTAGADVQDDRIEIEAVAWGIGHESWGIHTEIFYGDPASTALWSKVNEYLLRTWEREDGIKLPIAATCIDSGGHYTQQVYDFVRGKEGRRIFAIKGVAGTGKPIVGRASRGNKGKVPLYPIGVDTAKELLLLSWLRLSKPGPGYCHFPQHYDDEYFEQLTAEKQVTRYHKGFPRREWIKTRPRNEALDMRVYAIAAMMILNPVYDKISQRLNPETKPQADGPEKPEKPARSNQRQKPRRSRGGFATNW